MPIVILVFICWSLKVHPMPEGISLQVFQVRHFCYNKGVKGCKLRGNVVMKCKSAILSDKEGSKGTGIEEDRNIAWKKEVIFWRERSPSVDYSCFKLWKFLQVNLCSQTWWIKLLKKSSTKIGSNLDTLHLKYAINSTNQHLRVTGFSSRRQSLQANNLFQIIVPLNHMKKWTKEGALLILNIYFKELSQMTLNFSQIHFGLFSVQLVCLGSWWLIIGYFNYLKPLPWKQ